MCAMSSRKWLKVASLYASYMSGCLKVKVGAVIVKDDQPIGLGANRAIPDLCVTCRGCLREEIWGNNSKEHRNPEDCRAIHSEVDAICNATQSVKGAAIYITRYPCEACARAIVAAGITRVYYGREQVISQETRKIFDSVHMDVYHINDYKEDDTVL